MIHLYGAVVVQHGMVCHSAWALKFITITRISVGMSFSVSPRECDQEFDYEFEC